MGSFNEIDSELAESELADDISKIIILFYDRYSKYLSIYRNYNISELQWFQIGKPVLTILVLFAEILS